jgi:hypothetical protein
LHVEHLLEVDVLQDNFSDGIFLAGLLNNSVPVAFLNRWLAQLLDERK